MGLDWFHIGFTMNETMVTWLRLPPLFSVSCSVIGGMELPAVTDVAGELVAMGTALLGVTGVLPPPCWENLSLSHCREELTLWNTTYTSSNFSYFSWWWKKRWENWAYPQTLIWGKNKSVFTENINTSVKLIIIYHNDFPYTLPLWVSVTVQLILELDADALIAV